MYFFTFQVTPVTGLVLGNGCLASSDNSLRLKEALLYFGVHVPLLFAAVHRTCEIKCTADSLR